MPDADVFESFGIQSVFFLSNEVNEPIRFHISHGNPSENDSKVWVLANGSFGIAHNKGRIPEKDMTRILSLMQSYYFDYIRYWKDYFGEDVSFYS